MELPGELGDDGVSKLVAGETGWVGAVLAQPNDLMLMLQAGDDDPERQPGGTSAST
jgi:hypothetical protein